MKEVTFMRKVLQLLRNEDYFITRIESGSTRNGIPDTHIVGHGGDCFIEFKFIPKQLATAPAVQIPWRPGQLAWMNMYNAGFSKLYRDNVLHDVIYSYTKTCWTAAGFNDGVLLIKMHPSVCCANTNTVQVYSYAVFALLNKSFSSFDWKRFLKIYTESYMVVPNDSYTWYSYIRTQVRLLCNTIFYEYTSVSFTRILTVICQKYNVSSEHDMLPETVYKNTNGVCWLYRNIVQEMVKLCNIKCII